MSARAPSVSVAIRAYRRQWLAEAVASVLVQTHHDLELVIYDGAGTLDDVVRAFADERIRYHRAEQRLQASGRFAAAVSLCRGRYIGVLDDDDRYEPEFVARHVEALDHDAGAGIAFCRTTWEMTDGRRFAPVDPRPPGRVPRAAADMLSKGWTVSPSLMLMRRAALDAIGLDGMPDGIAPDQFVNLRTAVSGWHHVLVDAPLAVCRWHDAQLSRTFPTANDMAIATWRSLGLSTPDLDTLVRRRLARALLVRALGHVRAGDVDRARLDLRDAHEACPSAWPGSRRLLRAAAAWRPAGRVAAWAWRSLSPRGRRLVRPPAHVGDR